ncbi:MAG: FecR domain-containing protein [Chloracidobacterium sp.]|uniref:FecR domain-containing protein n=1 Tax=Chloracidobacterium validum TaxID=2821543 RepID=A0ABX8BBD0_9BACT|nr:FecR domain-containing protein [Chloracidobacterium validum]QUW03070.1 FecR domain-containing protein [Chloracidobacterium validum]
MQRSILTVTFLAGACALSVAPVTAQTISQPPTTEVPIRGANTVNLPEQFIVSAKAGTINFVEGEVLSCRARQTDAWQSVTTGNRLKTGDRLRTGPTGRAELLLNPGSYLRLDHEAEIVLTNPNLDALAIEITRGSALFEVTGTDGTELFLRILTPNGTVNLARNGLYRITVPPDGAPTVAIAKGRIAVDQAGRLTPVKDKQLVTLEASTVTVAKLDKKAQDDFDAWSRNRAKTLRDANARLKDRDVLTAFNGWRQSGAYGFGYAPFFGLWLFDMRLGGYTFFPFYGFWNSPYGFAYGTSWGLPWDFYRPTLLFNPMNPSGPLAAGTRQAPAAAPAPPPAADPDPHQPGHEPLGEMSGRQRPMPTARPMPTPPRFDPGLRSAAGMADDDHLPALPRRELPSPTARPSFDDGGFGKPGYEPPMRGGLTRGGLTPDYGGAPMRGGYGGDAGPGISPSPGGGMRQGPPARSGGDGSTRTQSPVVE